MKNIYSDIHQELISIQDGAYHQVSIHNSVWFPVKNAIQQKIHEGIDVRETIIVHIRSKTTHP